MQKIWRCQKYLLILHHQRLLIRENKRTMKFYNTSLETVAVLAINEEEFALMMRAEKGNVAIVFPEDNRPRIFRTFEEATHMADAIAMVSYHPGDTYAKAWTE